MQDWNILILVLSKGKVYILDLAAKLDATADFVCKQKWGEFEFPPAFGRDAFPEVWFIMQLYLSLMYSTIIEQIH